VLCLGWWEQYKRFEDVVAIWPQVASEVPYAVLVVAGDARPGSRSGVLYKPKLLKAVAESPQSDWLNTRNYEACSKRRVGPPLLLTHNRRVLLLRLRRT
jgi:hypothetical protein